MRPVLLLAGALLCLPVAAQTPPEDSSPPLAREHTTLAPSIAVPSTAAYDAAVERMRRGMDIPVTGNADRDFVAAMIPHRQGAIDLAKVELQHGTDPQVRKLAQDLIAAGQQEIAALRQWQAAHPK
jgi:uncharacterized protein (DUF305 family)